MLYLTLSKLSFLFRFLKNLIRKLHFDLIKIKQKTDRSGLWIQCFEVKIQISENSWIHPNSKHRI